MKMLSKTLLWVSVLVFLMIPVTSFSKNVTGQKSRRIEKSLLGKW